MSLRVELFFPPGWTLATGSPHLALPLLAGFLRINGIDVKLRDLNFECSTQYNVHVSANSAARACTSPTLSSMNSPYFAAEDEMMRIAQNYNGHWNAQLGFWYEGSPERSSKTSMECLDCSSPFDEFYKLSVIPEILSGRPDIVGLGIASVYQIIPALKLCQFLRAEAYPGFIVMGGNTISRLLSEMAFPQIFDLVNGLTSFQGELPLLKLCRALDSNQSLDVVPQLTWRTSEGVIRQNPQGDPVDVENVSIPDYDDLPVGRYWGENYLCIVAARGCYYGRCTFCAIPYGWGNGGYTGVRSHELTYEDMLGLVDRHGIKRFKFVDEALSPNFMRALAKRIIADGVDVEWEGYVRFEPSWYEKGFVELVSRAGFRKGYFGLEVVPTKRRQSLHKQDRAQPEQLLLRCSEAGIKAHLFCMFGFPGTGEYEAAETVDFLIKHQHSVDTADIFPWTYAKHTNVPGVEPMISSEQDWALEFDHVSKRSDAMSSEAIREMASGYEEVLWDEVPRFLHPTYRLVSPWVRSASETKLTKTKFTSILAA